MIDISHIDYSDLDRPEILMLLFHPRAEGEGSGACDAAEDVLIPVEEDVVVGGRFHMAEKSAPNILFFHGNGEIVADYNEMGSLYTRMGINFMPVDYRGYGRSTGQPTITAMMRDCHVIFDKSTLIIHAERDHIIPFSDGQALYDACQAVDKTFLKIPGANHNDIFLRGMSEYMTGVRAVVEKVKSVGTLMRTYTKY